MNYRPPNAYPPPPYPHQFGHYDIQEERIRNLEQRC